MSSQHSSSAAASADRTIDRLKSAHPRLRRELLADFLHEQLAYAMGIEKGQIDRRDALMNLGMDSLKAVEAKMFLEDELGLSLESSLLFDHPTIDALTVALLAALGLDAPAAGQPQVATSAPAATSTGSGAAVNTLTTDEVVALLSAELASLGLVGGERTDE